MDIIEELHRLTTLTGTLERLSTKTLAAQLGVVTDVDDPERLRRVRCASAANPSLNTHWFIRLADTGRDAPLPKVGDTVLYFCVDGDETVGFYVPIQNTTNPPHEDKLYPKEDLSERARNATTTALEKITLRAGLVFIEINAAGVITVQAPLINLVGNIVQMPTAGATPQDMEATFSGNFRITNAQHVSINGQDVATVGAVDDDNDTLVTKGW
jgi:phage baseplate assembly protein gpV